MHEVVMDDISANMASLVHTSKYGGINAADTTPLGYYARNYVNDTFTLKEDTTTDVHVSKAGKLVFR